jgi:cytochrome oxidase Cu insertion factor (SCO1/SenC/PrrC family)
MPGMHSGLNVTNSVLVTAFRSALMHQGLVALLILASLAVAWMTFREWLPKLRAAGAGVSASRDAETEPAGRKLLRIGFGLIWVFDGILQAQPAMAAGLPGKVIAPAAADAPGWIRDLVNWGGSAWSFHPIADGAAAVWIQIGIGIWMLASARGPWSRAAGLAGAGWAVVIWVFGEAFGGLFNAQSLLFGFPGAAAYYFVAGILLALPERILRSTTLGRWLLRGLGVLFAAMAVLQAWPGRGFWQGQGPHGPGALTNMVTSMAGTPQPAFLGHLVSDFGSFTASHGFLVNALCVLSLGGIGVGLAVTRGRLRGKQTPAGLSSDASPKTVLRAVVIATAVFCLADWVLVQDLGFFGGVGTDPNSMVPLLLVVVAAYLVATQEPQPAEAGLASAVTQNESKPGWRERVRPVRLAAGVASASATGILAFWAVVLVLIGAAPMALAQANRHADPIIAQAIDGSTAPLDSPAPPFSLTDASGNQVSLASLHGKVVLLTFLDPVCTSDCPLIAQELRDADHLLGAKAKSVELVAVAANPLYYTAPYLAAFNRQENLAGVSNWTYLTGPLKTLRSVWFKYGISAVSLPGGQMIAHNDLVFVIDAAGHVRYDINSDPGPGSSTSISSFAVEFAQLARRAMQPASPLG